LLVRPEENEHRARHQQKDQHHSSEHCLVEPTVKFHAKPSAGEQSEQKQPDRVRRYHTFDTTPLMPSHAVLIRKIATATGWKIVRW